MKEKTMPEVPDPTRMPHTGEIVVVPFMGRAITFTVLDERLVEQPDGEPHTHLLLYRYDADGEHESTVEECFTCNPPPNYVVLDHPELDHAVRNAVHMESLHELVQQADPALLQDVVTTSAFISLRDDVVNKNEGAI